MAEAKEILRRTATGKVISNKGEKTITVLVERRVQHRFTARSSSGQPS